MVDFVVGYSKANASHILKLFLTGVDDLIARATQGSLSKRRQTAASRRSRATRKSVPT
jgi:hypothetical protein